MLPLPTHSLLLTMGGINKSFWLHAKGRIFPFSSGCDPNRAKGTANKARQSPNTKYSESGTGNGSLIDHGRRALGNHQQLWNREQIIDQHHCRGQDPVKDDGVGSALWWVKETEVIKGDQALPKLVWGNSDEILKNGCQETFGWFISKKGRSMKKNIEK